MSLPFRTGRLLPFLLLPVLATPLLGGESRSEAPDSQKTDATSATESDPDATQRPSQRTHDLEAMRRQLAESEARLAELEARLAAERQRVERSRSDESSAALEQLRQIRSRAAPAEQARGGEEADASRGEAREGESRVDREWHGLGPLPRRDPLDRFGLRRRPLGDPRPVAPPEYPFGRVHEGGSTGLSYLYSQQGRNATWDVHRRQRLRVDRELQPRSLPRIAPHRQSDTPVRHGRLRP